MKKIPLNILLICFLGSYSFIFSQKPKEVAVIKVKTEKVFVKAAFDESDYKIVAIDQLGNKYEEAIQSFSVKYKDGSSMNLWHTTRGNKLPQSIIDVLTKKNKSATKICIGDIKAIDKDGNIENLPGLCDIIIYPEGKKPKK